jgi:hypothetical protein
MGNVRNTVTQKITSGSYDKKGYKTITLHNEQYCKVKKVHRLVLQSFHPCEVDGMDVNHISGVKDDNRLANLEWATRSENLKHAYRIGLINKNGERHPRTKLTNDQVREIKEILIGRTKHKKIAELYGVSLNVIKDISKGKNWKCV